MASLISTLGLSAGDYIKAKVVATNARGSSGVSQASADTVKTQVAPTASPANLSGTSTKDSITLTWNVVTGDANIGYSGITEYRVYETTGTQTLRSTVNALTTTLTSLTPAGNIFKYKVAAYNIHGEGPLSTEYSIKLAGVPATMDPVVLTQSGTAIVFSWTEPNANGEALTAMNLQLLDKADSTYREFEALCNGTDYLGNATPQCSIEMASFRSTLSYTIGQDISAKIYADNAKGSGTVSAISNTIVAQNVPQTAVVINTSTPSSTITSITFSWNALTANTDTGYSAITSYTVGHNNGAGTSYTNTTSVTSGTTVTISGLTTGTEYTFVVTPVNVHGNGPVSSTFSMVAADVPADPAAPSVTQTSGSTAVTFSWTEPTTNGLPITRYELLLYSPVGTNNYTEFTGLCNARVSPVLTSRT